MRNNDEIKELCILKQQQIDLVSMNLEGARNQNFSSSMIHVLEVELARLAGAMDILKWSFNAGEVLWSGIQEELEETAIELEAEIANKKQNHLRLVEKKEIIEVAEEPTIDLINMIADEHMNLSSECPVMPGQIFYASWGYEQTNIDFFLVESVTKSGKSAILVPIKSIRKATGDMTAQEMPDVDGGPDGEKITKKIHPGASSTGPAFKLESYKYAYRWDGRPKSSSSYA